MTGYGVKLSKIDKKDLWRYTFHLQRERNQDHMEKALCHPNSDQLDDWEAYRAGLTDAPDAPEEEMIEDLYEGY